MHLLFWTAKPLDTEMFHAPQAATSNQRSMLEHRHSGGPDLVNIQDANGDMPLHYASLFSGTTSTTSIDQLLDLGADSSCRNAYSMTPSTMRAWASIRRGFGPGLYMELQLGDMPIKQGLQAIPLHQDRCSGVVIWSGSNSTDVGSNQIPHVSTDLYKDSQQPHFNYKLLISSVVSRPIAFISTRSADGNSTNLAAFSYFNIVNYDPPRFVVSFTGGLTSANDTLHNISESSEYVINITSEGFLEAANATEVNVPYGVSEWDISELTPVYNCEIVNAARGKRLW